MVVGSWFLWWWVERGSWGRQRWFECRKPVAGNVAVVVVEVAEVETSELASRFVALIVLGSRRRLVAEAAVSVVVADIAVVVVVGIEAVVDIVVAGTAAVAVVAVPWAVVEPAVAVADVVEPAVVVAAAVGSCFLECD